MPKNISNQDVQKLVAEGAQLVEVLPSSVYEKGHLPAAINIPLTTLSRSTANRLDKERPVVVYCYDFL